jgi:tRNA(Ile)-lysidine synthase
MKLFERFEEYIKRQNLFSVKDKLLLAVSGGVDSVVLCELCKQAGYDFMIAHCNFQLRGEESERDEQFVKNLGNKYGVEVLVKKFDTEPYALERKVSIQEAARELRYGWFSELINKQLAIDNKQQAIGDRQNEEIPIHHSPVIQSGAKDTIHLLTAHHADDNIETLSMNFFRGTGLHGLTGIPVKAGHIRRPLLEFPKEELLKFARENNLKFVEDSSNQSSKYTRNFFRNEIIPAIAKVYPQVKENLQDNIERFKEIEKLYRLSVTEIKKKLCKQKNDEVHIPVKQLMGYTNRALIYEIISGYGFNEKQVEEVIKLAKSESGRYIQAPGDDYRMIRHRHWFIITPTRSEQAANIIIEEKDKRILFALGTFYLEMTAPVNHKPQTTNSIALLDSGEITFPLLLRKWKTGDYFYPLGMKKKKKLARFFIDLKLSKTDKEKVWVLETKQRIAWVVGYRIDDRFKITDSTKEILHVSLEI